MPADRHRNATPAAQRLWLDSVSVRVDDLYKASAFLTEVMGWRAYGFRGETGADADSVFFDGHGAWLQLVPASALGNDRHASGAASNGGYFRLNFVTGAYDAALDALRSRGASVSATGNGAMASGGDPTQRMSLCAPASRPEAAVAVHEKADGNYLSRRDLAREPAEPGADVPRIDRIAVVVEDIEASSAFYTRVLGLQRHPMQFGVSADANEEIGGFIPAFLYAGGAWLVLIQPVGDGPLMQILRTMGDGHVMEVITEVADLARFYDRMAARGIALLALDGTPLRDGNKCQVLQPYGDKLAYLPTETSEGMVIEVFERGPRETSLIHQRDDTFAG